MFNNLRKFVDSRRKINTTVKELSKMTDRDLEDIGIRRWQIKETARNSIL